MEGIDNQWDSRTRRLMGDEAVDRLRHATVAVAGVGGVGGYAVEMLARTGVGNLVIIDADDVSISNLNRQLIALAPDVGKSKVELFAQRCRNINPDINVVTIDRFITPENVEELIGTPDFVIDAIDTVAPKMGIINYCLDKRIPIISSMGAGGRTDPAAVHYADISETRDDGLAKAVRQRLRKERGRARLKVVCSSEVPHSHAIIQLNERNKRSSYGTTAIVPSVFGIYLASHVIDKLSNLK